MIKNNKKALQRASVYLSNLPAYFSVEDAKTHFCEHDEKSLGWLRLSLHRWKTYGLIMAVGTGNALGFYYNLSVDPNWKKHRTAVIQRIWAVSIIDCHADGSIVAIVPHMSSECVMVGIKLITKPIEWIMQNQPFAVSS